MTGVRPVLLTFAVLCVSAVVSAQDPTEPITNWTAPPYWTMPAGGQLREHLTGTEASPENQGVSTESASSTSPLSFTAITPCRLADTRGNGFTGQYGPPSLVAGGDRSFTITGQCGIPSGAAAVSFNFTIVSGNSWGDIRVYPAGTSLPLVSTQNWSASKIGRAHV